MSEAFFAKVRSLFGGKMTQAQVDGCEIILAESEGLPVEHRAYLLATSWHETARTMQPVRETLASTDESAVARLENAWRRGQLKWVSKPYWRPDGDGRAWFGRGYVQLTHKDNYVRAGAALGVDLARNPSLALRPDIAAKILVRGCSDGWFTGKRLSDYLPSDYVNARRVVNGTDRAETIAGYARTFEAAIRAIEASATPPKNKTTGLWAAILDMLKRIFT